MVLGGEFPRVNGIAQQGLVRMAVRSIAPNLRGPTYTTNPPRPVPPTIASSTSSGTVNVSFGTAWDYDDELLKYEVLRNGKGTPVSVTYIKSNFWTLPAASFTDTGLTPGSTLFYQIRITDPYGNTQWSLKSDVITVCCAGAPNAASQNTTRMSASSVPVTQANGSAASGSSQQGARVYLDPAAPIEYRPVRRKGRAASAQPIPASNGRLVASAAVRYSDRVLVSLTRMANGVEAGVGRGAFPKRPHTAFTFKITNHSAHALDLNQVVVTARTDRRHASPRLYTDHQPGISPGSCSRASRPYRYLPVRNPSPERRTVAYNRGLRH